MIELVRAFNEKYKVPDEDDYSAVGEANQGVLKHLSFIDEERAELGTAIVNDDDVGMADAVGDLLWVVMGMGIYFGFDVEAIMKEIARSNMTKQIPSQNTWGKIKKGDDYSPPNITKVMYE